MLSKSPLINPKKRISCLFSYFVNIPDKFWAGVCCWLYSSIPRIGNCNCCGQENGHHISDCISGLVLDCKLQIWNSNIYFKCLLFDVPASRTFRHKQLDAGCPGRHPGRSALYLHVWMVQSNWKQPIKGDNLVRNGQFSGGLSTQQLYNNGNVFSFCTKNKKKYLRKGKLSKN